MSDATIFPMPASRASRAPFLRQVRRTLTRRNAGIAAAIGFGLGAIHGIANLLISPVKTWLIVADAALASTGQALVLLVALAVAIAVNPSRVPRWLPFVFAAAVALAVSAGLEIMVGALASVIGGESPNMTWQDVAVYAWTRTPYFLITVVFAMFAATQAAELARRGGTLRRLQMEETRVARATYEARLVALQARVEPTFLFETLSDVEGIYDRDPVLGARVMDELIAYLRAALPAMDDTSSSLEVELALVRSWLDIARIRSGDQLTYAITEQAAPEARLPPMLLLPLVHHAAGGVSDRTRVVFVATSTAGERVRVAVIGPRSAFAASNPSSAVDAVRERVEALYGDTGSLVLQSVMHDRSQAILEIPYERTDRRPR